MLICPDCKNDTMIVISTVKGYYNRRRLKCYSCQERFTSFEVPGYELHNNDQNDFWNVVNEIKSRVETKTKMPEQAKSSVLSMGFFRKIYPCCFELEVNH